MASTASSTKGAQMDKTDPQVLGVSIPLTVTVTAAKQVGAAWREFGTGLVQALSQARESAKGTPKSKKKAGGDDLDSGASASAGVSA
jgi:hypothetical protein